MQIMPYVRLASSIKFFINSTMMNNIAKLITGSPPSTPAVRRASGEVVFTQSA